VVLPVTVEQVQEQPDGTKQVVRVDTNRTSWQVDNHGVNRAALTRVYDAFVKSPDDRKKLEISAPLLVAAARPGRGGGKEEAARARVGRMERAAKQFDGRLKKIHREQ
jgi:hypothetical protein